MNSSTFLLNSELSVVALNNSRTLISFEFSDFIIEGEIYQLIIRQFARGPCSIEQIMEEFKNEYPPAIVLRGVNQLAANRILTQNNDMQLEICPKLAESESVGNEERQSFLFNSSFDELIQAPQVIKHSEDSVVIVCIKDILDSRLKEINKEFLTENRAWMLVKPFGKRLLISSVLKSNETACLECLTYRMRSHRPMLALVNENSEVLHRSAPSYSPSSFQIAEKWIKEFIGREESDESNSQLLSIDLKTGCIERHIFNRRPQCPVCGEHPKSIDYPYRLSKQNSKPVLNHAGGYRTASAKETFEKYQHLVSPLCGIMPGISEYRPIGGAPFYNYSSGRNLALQSKSLFWLNNHMRSSSGGKGKDSQQAKTGALCEAIERYCLVHHGQLPARQASFNDLGELAVHPNECMNFSVGQFETREITNQKSESFYSMVPIPFDAERKIDWSEVYSLTHQKIKYLPSAFCYAQYPAEDESQLLAYPDSNGCASGNTMYEAVLQGTLELIERDAAAIWWYNRVKRPEVDLDSLNNGYVEEVRQYYQSNNRALVVLDITTDLNIPVFVAVSWNLQQGNQILYGFGCHLDANIALERSVIELNQLLPILLTERSKKAGASMYDWLDSQYIAENEYVVPNGSNKVKLHHQYQALEKPDIIKAVSHLIKRLENKGVELLCLDLTQPDIGMPVVKMIAPGLRHYWRRTGPGRLYDVPVRLGWLKAPNTEDQLNSFSITI